MEKLLLVFIGGGAGAIARYGVGVQTTRIMGVGATFTGPTATFIINVVGGLLMGVLVGWLAHRGGADQEKWRLLVGVGVLGGFTTFSTFSLDAALMIEKRLYGAAFVYVAASALLSIAGVFAGLAAARKVLA
jgi:CrcB protein